MKRLQQISTEKTLSVEVKCILNEHVIDKNFEAIIDCLKELHDTNSRLEKEVKEANDRSSKCQRDIQKLKESGDKTVDTNKETAETRTKTKASKQDSDVQLPDAAAFEQLQERLTQAEERTKKNNIENLKDINLLLSEMKDVKKRLDDLEAKSQSSVQESSERLGGLQGGDLDLQTTRILQNELQRHLQMIRKLSNDLDKLREQNDDLMNKLKPLEGLDKVVTDLKNSQANSNSTNFDASDLHSLNNRLAKIDSDLKRLDVLEQKFRLAPTSQDIDDKFAELRNLIEDQEETLHILQEELTELKNKKGNDAKVDTKTELTTTKQAEVKIDPPVISRRDRQTDQFHENEHRQLKDVIRDLTVRVDDLESSMKESREKLVTSVKEAVEERHQMNTTLNDKDKVLPNINKRSIRLKQPRDSVHNQSREHSTKDIDRRLFDLKGDLQQWLRQLLESRNSGKKGEEQLNDLELRLQEFRIIIDRKADQQGVRKYLTFLENKINQLFVVLAQPESEDALIARKGWGCLSCAKKLEKYKGRLGEHLNWNNMTTTNYSPPRIGFTQTQTNHKSGGERNRFASMADKNASFNYEQHHSEEK